MPMNPSKILDKKSPKVWKSESDTFFKNLSIEYTVFQ